MKRIGFIVLYILVSIETFAQHHHEKKDSINSLDSVTVTGAANSKMETNMKMGISIDEYLSSSKDISFIKKGAYAWEPLLNNMSTERTMITIDGMHIFGACTDKMDPITSYIETNNLSSIDVKSGQGGSMHGATIGGSIDLKRTNTPFGRPKKWAASYQSGLEWNNRQFYNLGNASYSSDRFVAEASVSFRKAGDYYDGDGKEVLHSQYNKFNTSLGLAYKTSELSSLRVDAIFDVAKNVGYPALPMDLGLSRALITSGSYRRLYKSGLVKVWDARFYFNAIEHYMDDTKRPENLVHMDMPGWSTTYGLVAKASLEKGIYSSEIQVNAYSNLSIAEMRMYPQDRSKRTMFAYSWPWVTTRYTGLSMNNSWAVSQHGNFSIGGSLGANYNYSKYIEFNWIFYPGSPLQKTRILPALHASYQSDFDHFNFTVGSGYGTRAPSVSEGYGYYIYNSFDRYDYIGNPNLKNETSYEGNASVTYKDNKLTIGGKVNYFHIKNYIIGRILSLGSPMNYQSVGVKGYTSLDYAKLFNLSANVGYQILDNLHWEGILTYARSQDNKGENLPFIRPLSYASSLHYTKGKFSIQTSVNGDLAQINYSPEYGEDQTPAYFIINASANYSFKIRNVATTVQLGVENLLDRYYSTYADWGNIPRMGRNVFASMKLTF